MIVTKFYQNTGWVESQNYVLTGKYCGKRGQVTFNLAQMEVEHWVLLASWVLW